MKRFILCFFVFACLSIQVSFVRSQTFSCNKLLEKEREVGFPVVDAHFKTLESIFQKVNTKITFKTNPSKEQALSICLSISELLKKEFGISYGPTAVLFGGLDSHKLDCNFYSILFYDILNKQHGYEVFPVVTPGHMFIRWHLNKGESFNYETTADTLYTDNDYINMFSISAQAIAGKVYMSDLSDEQIWSTNLVEMANNMPAENLDQKEKLCKEAVALDHKCVIAKLLEGAIYIDRENYELAITHYDQLYELDSMDYPIAVRIGMLYTVLEDHNKAEKYYSRAISINPANPELYVYRSQEYLRVNNVEKAMEDFDLASELLTKDNIFALLFNYILLTELEKEIMDKYLELNGGK